MVKWSWKKFTPRTRGDQFALFLTVGLIHFVVLFEAFVIIPMLNHGHVSHLMTGLFLYINVMISLLYTIQEDSTTENVVLPTILKPGWRFCSACEANAPPRSFHCWVCDRCILRRDHHCVFTGNCVGLNNQRHFIIFVGYLCLGALYCNYLNMDYTWELLGEFSLKTYVSLLAPFLAYAIGLLEGFSFFIALVSALSFFGFFLLSALLAYHLVNLVNGQLTHERSHNIKIYSLSRWTLNVEQVFGQRWIVSWLCSLISSPLPIDGLVFPRRSNNENIKDM